MKSSRTREKARSANQRQRRPAPAAATPPEWIWPALGALGIVVLFWTCRGAPIGTAVADDYSFLSRLAFQRPLDPFDSMGAAYYWRPLSRQVYFSAIGGALLESPWVASVVGGALLLALFAALYRAARRGFYPPVAAAIAAFPLLGEPARVLLAWPSGVQHLMAATAVAWAVHEALAGRLPTAAFAALAGVASHESAALALAALPLIAWFRTRRTRDAWLWGAAAAGVAALWLAGYAVALRHGVEVPRGSSSAFGWTGLPGLFARGLAGPLNLETLGTTTGRLFAAGYASLLVLGIALGSTKAARARIARATPTLALAGACFAIGMLPLATLPDWNAWRAWVPSIGLGVAFTGLLGLASPWLAGGLVALRLAALLSAPAAPVRVGAEAPESISQLSFERLARLQRTVESTRRALGARFPELPRGGSVRTWLLPRLTEFGFQGPLALRVWYRDSTLRWEKAGGTAWESDPVDAMVEYLENEPWPAVVDEPETIEAYRSGVRLMRSKRYPEADSLFSLAERTHRETRGMFLSAIVQNRARIAINLSDFDRADSLNRICLDLSLANPDAWVTAARLALIRNDRAAAVLALRRCLAIRPDYAEAHTIARWLRENP